MWRQEDKRSTWKTYGFNRIHFGDRPTACTLEVCKWMVAQLGEKISPAVAEMMRQESVDDDQGGGT